MASKEARERVTLALFEGANPRGFTGENRDAYEELFAEHGEAGLARLAAAVGRR